MGFWAT